MSYSVVFHSTPRGSGGAVPEYHGFMRQLHWLSISCMCVWAPMLPFATYQAVVRRYLGGMELCRAGDTATLNLILNLASSVEY